MPEQLAAPQQEALAEQVANLLLAQVLQIPELDPQIILDKEAVLPIKEAVAPLIKEVVVLLRGQVHQDQVELEEICLTTVLHLLQHNQQVIHGEL